MEQYGPKRKTLCHDVVFQLLIVSRRCSKISSRAGRPAGGKQYS